MKRRTLSFLFITPLVSLLTSCQDELSTVGGKQVRSSLRTVQIDICTVRTSTTLNDSFATSGDTICQIGAIDNPVWGKIKTTFYAEHDMSGASFSEDTDYGFDSIITQFYFSGDHLGNTLDPQRISPRSLSENPSLDEGYLYSKSTMTYHATPLASFTLIPTSGETTREHEVCPSDEWGFGWLERFQNEPREMESQEYFHDYFKDIALTPEEGGSCINDLMVNNSSLYAILCYHRTKTDTTELSASFPANDDLRFNQVSRDRSQTVLSSLQGETSNGLPSGKSDHQAYLQELTGVYPNIGFPFLNDLCAEDRLVATESTLLRLYPMRGMYGEWYPFPESLTLHTADENNATEDIVTDTSGSPIQAESLVTDEMMGEEIYYSSDITSFLQNSLGTMGYNRETLQLMPSDNLLFTILSGVASGDTGHPSNNPVKLIIFYKAYNP